MSQLILSKRERGMEVKMRNRLIGSILAVVAVLAILPVILAQTAKQSGETKGPTATAARGNVPGTAARASAPDLSGVWMIPKRTDTLVLKEPVPLQPWAAAKSEAHKEHKNDPDLLCLPPGVPRVLLNPEPMEIIQIPGRVLILHDDDHLVRQIWMDGRKLPQDPDPTWMGYSVGRWDGDTLVIDTIGLTERSWLDSQAHPHTDALRVVERLRRIDHDTLQDSVTINDPKAYTKPWTGEKLFKLKPGWEIMENVCTDNEETNKKLTEGGDSPKYGGR